MTPEQEKRLVDSFESIAAAMTHCAKLLSIRTEHEYPDPKTRRPAEVINADKDKRDQYSDRADPEWFDETEAALPDTRFKERFDAANKQNQGRPVEQKRRRVVEVPKKQ